MEKHSIMKQENYWSQMILLELNKLLPENKFYKTNVQFTGNLETIVYVNDSGDFVAHEYFVKTGSTGKQSA